VIAVDTPHGEARAHLHSADRPAAAIILGHGAGGGVEAPDLVAATEVAVSEGVSVALVEQPYRVAGRRSPAPARQLEAVWRAAAEELRADEFRSTPLIVGGRSLGARVACRTAVEMDAVAVLCLAFPLQPPRRKGGKQSPSRIDELDGVGLPTLVVQGEHDQFGIPPAGPNRTVITVPGNHGLRADPAAVGDAVRSWLPGIVRELEPQGAVGD